MGDEFISRTYPQRPGRGLRLADISLTGGVVALLLALALPMSFIPAAPVVFLSLWPFGAVLSLFLSLTAMILGVVAVWKPVGRRQAIGGLIASTATLGLWTLYAALLFNILMNAGSL